MSQWIDLSIIDRPCWYNEMGRVSNSKMYSKIFAYIKNIKDQRSSDTEHFRKVVLLNIVCLIGIATLIPMGLLAFWQSNYSLGSFDFIVAALIVFTLIYLNRTAKTTEAGYMGITAASFLFWFLVFTGGVNNSAYVWIYSFPLFAMFLLGSKKGTVANILFFIPIVLFFAITPQFAIFTTYPTDLKMRIIPSFIVVLAYSYLFEFMRERSHYKLQCEIRDHKVTEKQLYEAKAVSEKANQAKSDFLANMSHELRTPLNHIIGFTELVLSKHFGDLNESQEEYLSDVHKSSNHLLTLINDILDISKVEAGKLTLNPSPVRLSDLLKNSLTIIKGQANKNGVTLSHKISDVPDTIMADELKLKQIMYNLLSNAVKFTPDRGKVLIKANSCPMASESELDIKKGARGVHIKVVDTGIGLRTRDIERIFEPFEQAETTKSKIYQGTGLGLALTKKLVELHGGEIWVESQGENKGSTFNLILPVDQNVQVDRSNFAEQ